MFYCRDHFCFQLSADANESYPQFFFRATLLAPGAYSIVRLMITKTYTTKDALSKSPEQRNCVKSHERTLRHFDEYTQENCLTNDIITAIEEGCGCVGSFRGAWGGEQLHVCIIALHVHVAGFLP